MNIDEALKACPFCGGDPELLSDNDQGNWVECGKCGASTNIRISLMDDARPLVVESWNRRAMPERDGEAVAWQVRVKWIRPRKGENEWSHWQFVDKEQHDAVLRGEGFFQYKNAEARALIVASAPAAVDGDPVKAWQAMTNEARRMQAQHLDDHEGDVYHAMQSLCAKFGCRDNSPMLEDITTANSAEGKVVPDALSDDAVIFGDEDDDGYRMGWNACREAMLNATASKES